jgi:hypothetical protein
MARKEPNVYSGILVAYRHGVRSDLGASRRFRPATLCAIADHVPELGRSGMWHQTRQSGHTAFINRYHVIARDR